MSFWTRITNVLRSDRVNREIDEEFESHIAAAVADGRDPDEARRAFGSMLRHGEQSRDMKVMPRLDWLRADIIFGWRQLKRNYVTTMAAIFSLALAAGACGSAFRIIDAMLLRPLPVDGASHLYVVTRRGVSPEGKPLNLDECEYPLFERMRASLTGQAEVIAISPTQHGDLTYANEADTERAYFEYVSGSMFDTFGLHPVLGRLLNAKDDITLGAHPYAVISYDYWTRRFARDRNVIGRTFRMSDDLYQIVGVVAPGFTGTEPGTVTSIFVPTMMNPYVRRMDATWVRAWIKLNPGVFPELVRDKIQAVLHGYQEERAKGFQGIPAQSVDAFVNQQVFLEPAASGISRLQGRYRPSLIALSILVSLVLLIACANVANLMTAQAAARAREMALRVAIGAGRWRLVQMVVVEGLWIASLASLLGLIFAWWSAPFVVSLINPRDNPARLALPADWRVFLFGITMTCVITLLFSLAPALRASAVKPVSVLKGGNSPRSQRHLMHVLIAAQVAFCFLVIFVAGLFVTSFQRLSQKPTGFSADHLLVLDTRARSPQPGIYWDQVADQLRTLPGVKNVALSSWPLLGGMSSNRFVATDGMTPNPQVAYFLNVSPNWIETMKIPLLDGRDFTDGDIASDVAIVTKTFAHTYFKDENPIGRSFVQPPLTNHIEIVGLVGDTLYRDIHEQPLPLAFFSFHTLDPAAKGRNGTFLVRTSSDPLVLSSILRKEVSRLNPEFHVNNIRTQLEINQAQTLRERLLATLAFFFGAVALLLAGVGLYGMLNYLVQQRRRELGIRIAVGARLAHIARGVTASVFSMIILGSLAGLAIGIGTTGYIRSMLYEVRTTEPGILAVPAITILLATLMASLPAVVRAMRIDPVEMLRSE
ncbi:MAG TPA: ABC transporter permease [Terriglobales bacterium]